MILVDTSVLSEGMAREPDANALRWFMSQRPASLFVSTITVAEMRFGVGILPEGRRKAKIEVSVEDILATFAGRTLPFDEAAARRYATLAAEARRAGRGFPRPDGYIAAIASVHGLAVATRDDSAFAAAGLTVIDPWAKVNP